jgi:hypothetical protein
MAEPILDWHNDAVGTVIGGCASLPHMIALISPAQWGKVALKVYGHGDLKHERELSNADAAKEAAVVVARLLMIREESANGQ